MELFCGTHFEMTKGTLAEVSDGRIRTAIDPKETGTGGAFTPSAGDLKSRIQCLQG
jgi:hypothetical protein